MESLDFGTSSPSDQPHAVPAELHIESKSASVPVETPRMKDYEKIKLLGEGSYAKVYKVKNKINGKISAMKAILKAHMKKVSSEHS